MEPPKKLHTSVLSAMKARLSRIKKIQVHVGKSCDAKKLEQRVYLKSNNDELAYERLLKHAVFTITHPTEIISDPKVVMPPIFDLPDYGDCESMVQCKRCKSSVIDMENRQIRAADEGMTTFFCCRLCGSRWTVN